MTPEVAKWLRDEILAQLTYSGTPDELRVSLARHDDALKQLAALVGPPPTPRKRRAKTPEPPRRTKS